MRQSLALLCCVLMLAGCTPAAPASPPAEPDPPVYVMPGPSVPDYVAPGSPGGDEEALALPAIPPEWGSMTSFYYEYGSYFGGYYVYSLLPQPNGKVHFEAWGYNDAAGVEASVLLEPEVLQDLQYILDISGISAWNGFNACDNDILDGYDFHLKAEFDSGHLLEAQGYMFFPFNYEEAHALLAWYLSDLADANPLGDGQPV